MKSYIRHSSLANHQPEVIDILLKITGSKTNNSAALSLPIIVGYDDSSFTQAASDALLGTGDISAVTTVFGSTRMDTDCLGIVLNFEGQVRQLIAVEVVAQLATGVSAVLSHRPAEPSVELDNTPADLAEFAITPLGNVYGSITLSGLDNAVAGFIHLRIICRLK